MVTESDGEIKWKLNLNRVNINGLKKENVLLAAYQKLSGFVKNVVRYL